MKAAEQQNYEPRKAPKQGRAMHTVDSILQATQKILSNEGYERASTNYIAEVAGVSIGSLYQYFPSKEAIVSSLVEKAVVEAAETLREELLSCMGLPLEESTPRMVRAILETRKENAFVFLRLPREIPRYRAVSKQLTTEKYLHTTIQSYYMQHRDRVGIEDMETAIFVTEQLVIGCIDAYLDNNSPKIDDETLVDHLSMAVLNYLAG
ncbi:MAG: TetR family transcriptional regulator [Cellvibrionaceae bacterium]|nr:TetR family transcriptional regulator [Cellvibrionaceae bacterium]|tara:strand:+ start:2193 stop:2816 length:624 start_codon:yes stop_codon:yes gene_type:complete